MGNGILKGSRFFFIYANVIIYKGHGVLRGNRVLLVKAPGFDPA
jgi:hypothetical protein